MTDSKTSVMVETAVVLALALALSQLRIFRAPQGGSVTLVMVPLFILAFRRGARAGMIAGALFGLLRLTLDAFVVHWIQFLLDYSVAFAFLGVAGFFRDRPNLGMGIGVLGRFICHFIAGMVFFAAYAPEGTPVVVYSLAYNASFLIPEAIIALLAVPAVARRLPGETEVFKLPTG